MKKARVEYTFVAEEENELSVNEGDIVEVSDVGDVDGWSTCTFNGKTGLVPTSYIVIIQQEEPKNNRKSYMLTKKQQRKRPQIILVHNTSNTPTTTTPTKSKEPRSPRPPPSISLNDAMKLIQSKLRSYSKLKKLRTYMKSSEFKQSSRRNKLIAETIETERSYVECLKLLVELFYKPLKAMAAKKEKGIDEKLIKSIFSNIEQIYQINSMFLNEMVHI